MTVLHPIRIAMPLPAGVHIGALVTYRGRRPGEQHSVFYVQEVGDDNRLTLVDRDYPGVSVLHLVDPHVVSPTGVTVALCPTCGHERGRRPSWSTLDVCDAHPACACLQHPIRTET